VTASVQCTIGSDDQGRRSYLIPTEYTDEEAERFLADLRANPLTVKVEFHHRRLGPNKYVQLFIPVPQGKSGEVDDIVQNLAGVKLVF